MFSFGPEPEFGSGRFGLQVRAMIYDQWYLINTLRDISESNVSLAVLKIAVHLHAILVKFGGAVLKWWCLNQMFTSFYLYKWYHLNRSAFLSEQNTPKKYIPISGMGDGGKCHLFTCQHMYSSASLIISLQVFYLFYTNNHLKSITMIFPLISLYSLIISLKWHDD